MGVPGLPDFSQVFDLIDQINDTYTSVSSIDVNGMRQGVQSLTKLDEMKSTIDELDSGVVGELTNEIATWNNQIDLLNNIQKTITDINSNIGNAYESITTLNDSLGIDLIKTITDIKTNIEKSVTMLEQVPAKLTELGSGISQVVGDVDDMGKVVSTLSTISTELIEQLNTLKKSIESVNVDAIENGLTDDLTKIKTVIGAVNAVKQQVTDLEKLSEIDQIITSLEAIPKTLETLLSRATELKSVIPEAGELITTVDSMIENGNNLTGGLTTQIKDVLKQVETIPTYLEYVNKIHDVINGFAPSMEELEKQVGRLTSYEDIKQFLTQPIEEAKKKIGEAESSVKKIIDFVLSLPEVIYKLITGVLEVLIDILLKVITDYLPNVIVIVVLIMLFLYFYPIVIGLVI
jgi:chromosome segregation ATPase